MNKKLEAVLKRGFRAAKCLAMLKLTTSRIKVLRNKKAMASAQLRKEIARLLRAGKDSQALVKVDMLIKEQNTLEAYDLIDQFARSVLTRMPLIEAQRTCPPNMKEPIASLIFAAPRCPDLEELMSVREMFISKFGKEFAVAVSELRPGSGVNRLLVEKLTIHPAIGQVKIKMLKDIARENRINWTPAFETTKVPGKTPDAFEQGLQSTSDRHHQPAELSEVGKNTSLAEPQKVTLVSQSQPVDILENAAPGSASLAVQPENEVSTTIAWHDDAFEQGLQSAPDKHHQHAESSEVGENTSLVDPQNVTSLVAESQPIVIIENAAPSSASLAMQPENEESATIEWHDVLNEFDEHAEEEEVNLPEYKSNELHTMLQILRQHKSVNEGESIWMIEKASGQKIPDVYSQNKGDDRDSAVYRKPHGLAVGGKESSTMELLPVSSSQESMLVDGNNEDKILAMEASSCIIKPTDDDASLQHNANPKEMIGILQKQFEGFEQMSNKLEEDSVSVVFDGITNGMTSEFAHISSITRGREDTPFSGSSIHELSSETSKETNEQVASDQEDYLQATSSYLINEISDDGILHNSASIEEAQDVLQEHVNALQKSGSFVKLEASSFDKVEDDTMGYIEKSELSASFESKQHGSKASEMESDGLAESLQHEVPSEMSEETWEENPFFYWKMENSVQEKILPDSLDNSKVDEVIDEVGGYRNPHMEDGSKVEEGVNSMGHIWVDNNVVSSRNSSTSLESKFNEDIFVFSSASPSNSAILTEIVSGMPKFDDEGQDFDEENHLLESHSSSEDEGKILEKHHLTAHHPAWNSPRPSFAKREERLVEPEHPMLTEVKFSSKLANDMVKEMSAKSMSSRNSTHSQQDREMAQHDGELGAEEASIPKVNLDLEDEEDLTNKFLSPTMSNKAKPLFSDKAEEFVEKEHPFSDDMILSKKSSDHVMEERPWMKLTSSRNSPSSQQGSGKDLFNVEPEEDKSSFSESILAFEDEGLAERFRLPTHGRLWNKTRPLIPDREKDHVVNLASNLSDDILEEMPLARAFSSNKPSSAQHSSAGQSRLDVELGQEKGLSSFTQSNKSMRNLEQKTVLYDEPTIIKASDRFYQDNQIVMNIHQKELKWNSKALKREEEDGFREESNPGNYKTSKGYSDSVRMRLRDPPELTARNEPNQYLLKEEDRERSLRSRGNLQSASSLYKYADKYNRPSINAGNYKTIEEIRDTNLDKNRTGLKNSHFDTMGDLDLEDVNSLPFTSKTVTQKLKHIHSENKRSAAQEKQTHHSDDIEDIEEQEHYQPLQTYRMTTKAYAISQGKEKSSAATLRKDFYKDEDAVDMAKGRQSLNNTMAAPDRKSGFLKEKRLPSATTVLRIPELNRADAVEIYPNDSKLVEHITHGHKSSFTTGVSGEENLEMEVDEEDYHTPSPNFGRNYGKEKQFADAKHVKKQFLKEMDRQGKLFGAYSDSKHAVQHHSKTPVISGKEAWLEAEIVDEDMLETEERNFSQYSDYGPAAQYHNTKASPVSSDKKTWLLGKDYVESRQEAEQEYYLKSLPTNKIGGVNHKLQVQQNKKLSAAVKTREYQEEVPNQEEEQQHHGKSFSITANAHQDNHNFGRNKKIIGTTKKETMHEVGFEMEEGIYRSHMPSYKMVSETKEPALGQTRKPSAYHDLGKKHFYNFDEEVDESRSVAVENRKDASYQGFGTSPETKPSTTSTSTRKQIRNNDDDRKPQKHQYWIQSSVDKAEATRASGDYTSEEYLNKMKSSVFEKKLEQQEEVEKDDDEEYAASDHIKVKTSFIKKNLQKQVEADKYIDSQPPVISMKKAERASQQLSFSHERLKNTSLLKPNLTEKGAVEDDDMISVAAYKKSARKQDVSLKNSTEKQGLSSDFHHHHHRSSRPKTKDDSIAMESASSSNMVEDDEGKSLQDAYLSHSAVTPPARPPPPRSIRSTSTDSDGRDVGGASRTTMTPAPVAAVPTTTVAITTATNITTAISDSVSVVSSITDSSSTSVTVEKFPTATLAPTFPTSPFSSTHSSSSFSKTAVTSTDMANTGTQRPLPHVHPKLPDFDELAVHMQALRVARKK